MLVVFDVEWANFIKLREFLLHRDYIWKNVIFLSHVKMMLSTISNAPDSDKYVRKVQKYVTPSL